MNAWRMLNDIQWGLFIISGGTFAFMADTVAYLCWCCGIDPVDRRKLVILIACISEALLFCGALWWYTQFMNAYAFSYRTLQIDLSVFELHILPYFTFCSLVRSIGVALVWTVLLFILTVLKVALICCDVPLCSAIGIIITRAIICARLF